MRPDLRPFLRLGDTAWPDCRRGRGFTTVIRGYLHILHRAGAGWLWTEGAGQKRGCRKAAIYAGRNPFKTGFIAKNPIKSLFFQTVDTSNPLSDPAFVRLPNGARSGLL